jgi:hypothetical protein
MDYIKTIFKPGIEKLRLSYQVRNCMLILATNEHKNKWIMKSWYLILGLVVGRGYYSTLLLG